MDLLDVRSFGEDCYDEYWTVVVNDHEYDLNPQDSLKVKKAIESGSKGIVVVKGAYLNLTYLQEFYLQKRVLKAEIQSRLDEQAWQEEEKKRATRPEYHLPEPTEEEKAELERQRKLLNQKMIERSKLVARGYNMDEVRQVEKHKPLSAAEETKRKEELLKQAEILKEKYGS